MCAVAACAYTVGAHHDLAQEQKACSVCSCHLCGVGPLSGAALHPHLLPLWLFNGGCSAIGFLDHGREVVLVLEPIEGVYVGPGVVVEVVPPSSRAVISVVTSFFGLY